MYGMVDALFCVVLSSISKVTSFAWTVISEFERYIFFHFYKYCRKRTFINNIVDVGSFLVVQLAAHRSPEFNRFNEKFVKNVTSNHVVSYYVYLKLSSRLDLSVTFLINIKHVKSLHFYFINFYCVTLSYQYIRKLIKIMVVLILYWFL